MLYHGDTRVPPGRRSRLSTLLIVEDDNSVRTTLVTCLELEGYQVDAVATTREALERLGSRPYPIVVSDIYLDERTGLDVLEAAHRADPKCAVILMTGRGSMETVMAATRQGAFDYIAKPFELDVLLETVKRAEASQAGTSNGDGEVDMEDPPESELIGSSAAMVELYKTVSRVAPTDANVLLEGETGTGKEVVARMIHRNSLRAAQPLQAVDCASVAPSLLESELFGAMKGSYTGADRDRMGVFEAADRGSVFLDEIGEIDLGFQQRLLRFLEEREVRPLGSNRARPVDVRVIAATNRDIAKMVDEGKFREDLWFRINVVRLEIPPLRERSGDIPLLALFFLRKYNGRYNLPAILTESGVREMEDLHLAGQRAPVAAHDGAADDPGSRRADRRSRRARGYRSHRAARASDGDAGGRGD